MGGCSRLVQGEIAICVVLRGRDLFVEEVSCTAVCTFSLSYLCLPALNNAAHVIDCYMYEEEECWEGGQRACTVFERESEPVQHVSGKASLSSMWAGKRACTSTACEKEIKPVQRVSGKASQYSVWAGKRVSIVSRKGSQYIMWAEK
jgi:hypothetical protein